MIRVALSGLAPFQAVRRGGGGPAAGDGGPLAAAFGRLSASGFALPGAELRLALAPLAWFAGASAVLDAADAADALILIDAARGGPDLAVIAAAANRADPRLPDAAGDHWPGDVLAPGGAGRLAAGLDAAVFARALTLAGLSVALSEPRDAGIANHCFYTLARRGALAARLQIGPGCAPAVLDEALRAAALFAGACAEVRATAAV